jgi:AcrR family transcriptional regulator
MPLTQQERATRTKGLLVAAAQHLLAEDATDTPISEICKQAGVAVGSFYNYYRSRDELIEDAALGALFEYQPILAKIGAQYEDPALGLLASFRHSTRLAEINPNLAKIIVNAGPKAFTDFSAYGTPPRLALESSIELGYAKCADPVAFLVACSGAYQNVLAFSVRNPEYSPKLADFTIALFARELGYDEKVIANLLSQPLEPKK